MSVTVADVKKVFTGIVPDPVLQKMDPAKPMVPQGVDSLALTVMAVALEKAFGVKITPGDGIKLKSLNDVAAFINKA